MVMTQEGIANLSLERKKANALENVFYVTGMGLGSFLVADGLKRVFKKESTLKEKLLGVLGTVLGGLAAAESGHYLITQKPLRVYDPVLDAALWGTMMVGMDF